jgi:hypothetical protein
VLYPAELRGHSNDFNLLQPVLKHRFDMRLWWGITGASPRPG